MYGRNTRRVVELLARGVLQGMEKALGSTRRGLGALSQELLALVARHFGGCRKRTIDLVKNSQAQPSNAASQPENRKQDAYDVRFASLNFSFSNRNGALVPVVESNAMGCETRVLYISTLHRSGHNGTNYADKTEWWSCQG